MNGSWTAQLTGTACLPPRLIYTNSSTCQCKEVVTDTHRQMQWEPHLCCLLLKAKLEQHLRFIHTAGANMYPCSGICVQANYTNVQQNPPAQPWQLQPMELSPWKDHFSSCLQNSSFKANHQRLCNSEYFTFLQDTSNLLCSTNKSKNRSCIQYWNGDVQTTARPREAPLKVDIQQKGIGKLPLSHAKLNFWKWKYCLRNGIPLILTWSALYYIWVLWTYFTFTFFCAWYTFSPALFEENQTSNASGSHFKQWKFPLPPQGLLQHQKHINCGLPPSQSGPSSVLKLDI